MGVPPVVLRRIERRFDLRARLEVTEALGMMRPAPIFPPEVTLRRRTREEERGPEVLGLTLSKERSSHLISLLSSQHHQLPLSTTTYYLSLCSMYLSLLFWERTQLFLYICFGAERAQVQRRGGSAALLHNTSISPLFTFPAPPAASLPHCIGLGARIWDLGWGWMGMGRLGE